MPPIVSIITCGTWWFDCYQHWIHALYWIHSSAQWSILFSSYSHGFRSFKDIMPLLFKYTVIMLVVYYSFGVLGMYYFKGHVCVDAIHDSSSWQPPKPSPSPPMGMIDSSLLTLLANKIIMRWTLRQSSVLFSPSSPSPLAIIGPFLSKYLMSSNVNGVGWSGEYPQQVRTLLLYCLLCGLCLYLLEYLYQYHGVHFPSPF